MKWNTKLKSLKDNYKKYISIYVEANYLYLIISTQSSFSVSVIADLALCIMLSMTHIAMSSTFIKIKVLLIF